MATPRSHESREKLSRFISPMEDYAVFTMDVDGKILDWNSGAHSLKLYQHEEIIGRHFSIFYPSHDIKEGLPESELAIAAREGSYSVEGWRVRKDGSRFWASVILAATHSESSTKRYLNITRDLTATRSATEALRQSEERFRLLLESVQEYAIFMLDPEGHILSWNAGARRIKGYSDNEILGRHFSIFYTPEATTAHTPQNLINKALKEGKAEDEGWRVRKDGSRFWGNVVITALFDHTGELRGFAKITRDLTERRRVAELQESGRRKDTFLATLAHELRNPLAPMLPGVEIIQQSPDNPELVREIAAMLQRQVGQMAHLIDDLLDMSRITTGKIVLKKSDVDLNAVLTSAIESVQPMIDSRCHHFSTRLPKGPTILHADPHRISQVISNLLSNAAKYTPPGGTIELRARAINRTMIEISVTDNGAGIPLPLQENIFDLFDQGLGGSADGLGIGLTLVKTLVEMHDGKVSVDSPGVGQGSVFTISLPVLVSAPVTAASSPGKKHSDPSRSHRILVADDSKSAADILAMFFRMEGMETAVAYDGQQAVELAATFQPDLVCMDLGMPRMDGFEAARNMRELGTEIILVALSGWGAEDDRRRSAEAGFDHHLVKPVKPDDLREIIERFLTPT